MGSSWWPGCGGDPRREPVGKPVGPKVRERPDPHRRRGARLGRRLPGHGGGPRLAAGRPRLRGGRSGDRRGVCRRHLAPSTAHPSRTDGTGRQRVARPRVGRSPPWCTGGREPGHHRGTPVPVGARGGLQCAWGSCSPARFSTACGRARPRSAAGHPNCQRSDNDRRFRCHSDVRAPSPHTPGVAGPRRIRRRCRKCQCTKRVPHGHGHGTVGGTHRIAAGAMQPQVLNRFRRYSDRVRGWGPAHRHVLKVGGPNGYDECSPGTIRQSDSTARSRRGELRG